MKFLKEIPLLMRIQQIDDQSETIKEVLFDKPKILLIDLNENSLNSLKKSGFNVRAGTFGRPYKVDTSSSYQPLVTKIFLPNHSEQEIIIVDLKCQHSQAPTSTQAGPLDEVDLWGKCDKGFLDPRVRGVLEAVEGFDRILETGGVFIVFADNKTNINIKFGYQNRYQRFEVRSECPFDEWHFVEPLRYLKISNNNGHEMSIVNMDSSLNKLLNAHLAGSEYTCTLEGNYKGSEAWSILAKNKFGDAVALQKRTEANGLVLIFPQLNDKSGFLKSLFTEVLPEISPHLFPNITTGKWTHLSDYELPAIKQFLKDKSILEQNFINQSKLLDEKVLEERSNNGWMHDLITQTGDTLVHAIIQGLKSLGFKNIIDMDTERDKLGLARREDLQIQDKSPTLVVDIKGIANFPSDDDVLQANKHATLLMKEQNRTDINCLSIINHQRYLEPLQRDNILPFRQELLSLASELSMSLITSWDFYRLVINAKLNDWKFLEIQDILYDSGRSEIIPSHYKYIGKITKVWSEKFGVLIEKNSLEAGQKIAIEFPILFEEADVKELVVNEIKVSSVSIGDKTGISWPIKNTKPKEGMRVFSVS